MNRDVVSSLERATYRAETPVRRFVGSNRLNPLPHAGTISVFLLIVVIVTGVYITLFFEFGFEASHRSVEKMQDHPIQSAVRTIHRYASAGLVLTTVVHAWRVFVAGRFRGPRRWRWTTGVVALLIVWLAGVTGYWLVWDRRAQAITEAVNEVFGGVGWVSALLVRDVVSSGAGSGWPVMFGIWVAHLLLTAVITYFLWRHVRRSRLRLLPPRHWMLIMFGALLVVSLLFPADLLERADPGQLVGDMPLDPFVLFLLPPLLAGWGWIVLLGGVALIVGVAVAPHVRSGPTPVVDIVDDLCTGCELCVIDCPYLALSMHERSDADGDDGTQPRRPLAVVDADACVGCGICVGSCSFGAMSLPGFDPMPAIDPTGRHVVLACARHVRMSSLDATDDHASDTAVIEVACSGMVHHNAVSSLLRAGAASVQAVGCAPGDCAYGLGNTLLDQRLSGARAPHIAAKWSGLAAEDWVAPTELARAVAHPDEHRAVDNDAPPTGRRFAAATGVVGLSVIGVALATQAPFRSTDDRTAVRVVIDHTPGFQLQGQPEATGATGDDVVVLVRSDDLELARETVTMDGPSAVGIVDVALDGDAESVEVSLVEGDTTTELFIGPVEVGSGRRLLIEAADVPPPPGVGDGRRVFSERNLGGCGVCHSTRADDDGVGPSLAGVGDRASTRVPGKDGEAYLRESVLDPDAYIVDGYRAGQMLPTYRERLSDDDVDALVQYLLSLRDGGASLEGDG